MDKHAYNIKLETPFRTLWGRKITMIDFIDKDFKISLFDRKTNASGVFAQIENELTEETKNLDLNDEQREFIDEVLGISIKNYDNESLIDLERLIIFNQLLAQSTSKISSIIYPDKNLALTCHFMSKAYGGKPWDYVNMNIDEFLFNVFCHKVGTEQEIRDARKNKPKNKRK